MGRTEEVMEYMIGISGIISVDICVKVLVRQIKSFLMEPLAADKQSISGQ